MRAFKLHAWGVQEIDDDEARILKEDVSWSCLTLDKGHDVWVDDEAHLKPDGVFVARVGGHREVPLPAIVLGVKGGRNTDATLTWDDLHPLWEVTAHTSKR